MKILFVEPVIVPEVESLFGRLVRKWYTSNSLTFQQLAAATPKKHSIKFIDERFENINYDEPCDVVGITCTTYYATHAYEIADEFRKRGKTVILGGHHPSALPEEAKKHADSVVIGEGELLWPNLLKDIEKNQLKSFYNQTKPIDTKQIPPPRRDIVKKRLPVARIQATRGCPYNCKFCSISNVEGNVLRRRPIDDVIKEIKSIPQKILIFSDASLTIDPDYTKKLFNAMIGLNKKFSCCGNVDILAKDEELIKLSKKAGCIAWHIGFETFSQKSLDNIGKKTNRVEEYQSVVDKIHAHKMAAVGSFIIGFDEETVESLSNVLKSMNNLKVDLMEFGILTPFPGTKLFDQMEKEGRILTKDWSKYFEGDVVYKPKNIPVETLYNESIKIFWDVYFIPYSLFRMIRSLKFGFYPFLWTVMHSSLWV